MNYQLDNGILRVEISDLGGELQSIRTADGHEYLWQGDPTYWSDRAINLFPTVGRLYQGRYTYLGQPYELPLHGFLRNRTMDVRAEGQGLCFTLRDDEETRKMFPFSFCYEILYHLDGNRLSVCYRVKNEGSNELFFGLGGHPGFFVPMEEGAAFEDYRLRFATPGVTERVEFSGKGLFLREYPYPLSDGCIQLRHDLFDNDAIVLKNSGDLVILEHESRNGRRVELHYPSMPYIGFWQATKTDAPYVCIEPWQSLPGREDVCEEWTQRPGMIRLASEEQYENCWSISVF